MKRIIMISTVVIIIIMLQGCGTKNQHTTEISDYGSWQESTSNILDCSFVYPLPDSETVYKYGKEYYYKASQGALGDENFVLSVTLQFDDQTSYEEFTALLSDSVSQDDTAYYMIQYSDETAKEYTDDKIYDGMFYDFEIISTNSNNYTICFLNAHVWDYYKDYVLIDYLQLIGNILKEQGDGSVIS